MMRRFKWLAFVVVINAVYACNSDNYKYDRLVKSELSRGIHKDSLFMGIKFGMTQKEFYNYCWAMNKKGLFVDGANSMTVLYKLNNDLKYPASMNFFPAFKQNRIYKMRAMFGYDAFAPWNKQLFADSLQLDLLSLFKKWYKGTDFITMKDSLKGAIFVKVDGNRRIIIGKYDEAHVKVDYTDLLAEDNVSK
jgi:hypothetical protein